MIKTRTGEWWSDPSPSGSRTTPEQTGNMQSNWASKVRISGSGTEVMAGDIKSLIGNWMPYVPEAARPLNAGEDDWATHYNPETGETRAQIKGKYRIAIRSEDEEVASLSTPTTPPPTTPPPTTPPPTTTTPPPTTTTPPPTTPPP